MSKLVIVESPSKAKTLKKYLGKGFDVVASVGHVIDLPPKELGVDIEKNFKPKYTVISGKRKTLSAIKTKALKSDKILLATDPDREGEAIAWHIMNYLNIAPEKFARVLFHEITKSGVQKGIANPTRLNEQIVYAQQARRVLDRLVGYQVSPFLWGTVFRGLSAGRVQSVALRLLCERENEIQKFAPEEYWKFSGSFEKSGHEPFTAELEKIDGKKLKIDNEEVAKSTVADALEKSYSITSLKTKPVKKSPYAPFTTSTLQQAASQRLGMGSRRAMRIAQQLYEGVQLGEAGLTGLITYMRTDSFRISPEALGSTRDFIGNTFGKNYLPRSARVFGSKKKRVQDAHEAVRPTDVTRTPESISQFLDKDQLRLYTLIWNRFVACQMADQISDRTTLEISSDDKKYLFKLTASVVTFDGWRKIFRATTKDEDGATIPAGLSENDALNLLKIEPSQHFTKPPAHFNESSLIKILDELGIGRPSTYASIIGVLRDRQYVETDKKRTMIPTELGHVVNTVLVGNFPKLFNTEFTAAMEDGLDAISAGEQTYVKAMREFYHGFKKWLESAQEKKAEVKAKVQVDSGEKCEKCGEPMLIKWSKTGKFLACSGFPSCRNAKSLDGERPEPEATDEKCPKCNAPMVKRSGRFGEFFACSAFPKCKTTKAVGMGVLCPECDEELSERRSKKGKVFFGCTGFPKCRFASWDKPIKRECPNSECDSQTMIEKSRKDQPTVFFCPKCKTEV